MGAYQLAVQLAMGGGRGHGTSGKCDDTCTLLSGTGISPKLLEDVPGGVCARTGKAVSG